MLALKRGDLSGGNHREPSVGWTRGWRMNPAGACPPDLGVAGNYKCECFAFT
ncbi:hypothetical protein HMPREF0004_3513 [Achromobacter piechaudii ATCC 43553]|uniref:Uncharacterized protein n=1 Tax=Achromobacter piechaudii ATCC 43553 TaxID=742159 RepID=D4XDG6_9BURK|nr:hypothetical protein HMPREF0004_3513 [Achromobacter piechaudii ATCC 43553]